MKLKRLTAALAAVALFVGILPLNGFAACSGTHTVPNTAAEMHGAVPYSACTGGYQNADGTPYTGGLLWTCAQPDCTVQCDAQGNTIIWVAGSGVHTTGTQLAPNVEPYTVCHGGWKLVSGTQAPYDGAVYQCANANCGKTCTAGGEQVEYFQGDATQHQMQTYNQPTNLPPCAGRYQNPNDLNQTTFYHCPVCRFTFADAAGSTEAGYIPDSHSFDTTTKLAPRSAPCLTGVTEEGYRCIHDCGTVIAAADYDANGTYRYIEIVMGDQNAHTPDSTLCTDPHGPGCAPAHYHCTKCQAVPCDADGKAIEIDSSILHTANLNDVRQGNGTVCGGGIMGTFYGCGVCGAPCDANGNPVFDQPPDATKHQPDTDTRHTADFTPCGGGYQKDFYGCTVCGAAIDADAYDADGTKTELTHQAADTGHAVPDPNEVPCTDGHNMGCKTTPHYHCPNCPDATAIDQNGSEVQVQADGHLYDPQQDPCTDPHGEDFCVAKPHYHCPECNTACNENGEEVNILADDIHRVGSGSSPCTESHGTGCQAAVHYHCDHCGTACDADGKPVTVQGGKHTPDPNNFIENGDYTVCGGGINQSFYVCSVCWTPCDANGEDVDYTAPTAKHTPGTEKNNANYIPCNGGFKVDYYWCTVCQQPSDAAGNHVSFEEPTAPHNISGAVLNQPNYTACTGGFKDPYYLCNDCGTGCNANAEPIYPFEATHDLQFVEMKEPTDTTDGMEEHYVCRNCGNLFRDPDGWDLIPDPEDITIPAGSQNGEGSGVDVSNTVADAVNDALQADPDAESVTVSIKDQVPAGDAASLSGLLMDGLADADVGITLKTNDGDLVLSKEQVAALADQLPADSELVVLGNKELGIPVEAVDDNNGGVVAPIKTDLLDSFADAGVDLVILNDVYGALISANAIEAIADAAVAAGGSEVNLRLAEMAESQLAAPQKNALTGKDVALIMAAEMLCNGTKISSFGNGTVTIVLDFDPPAGTNGSDYKFWYLNPNGQMDVVSTSYQDGALIATFPHFSEYALIYTATGGGVPGIPAPAPAPAPVVTSPVTRDSALLLPHAVMMTVSAAGIVLLLRKKREQ